MEWSACVCAFHFTLIGMYKDRLRGMVRAHSFIHLNIFVSRTVLGFLRT